MQQRGNSAQKYNYEIKNKNPRPASAKLSIMMSNSRLKNLMSKKDKEKIDSNRNQVVIDQSVEEYFGN